MPLGVEQTTEMDARVDMSRLELEAPAIRIARLERSA
jgi:hypothetical protein